MPEDALRELMRIAVLKQREQYDTPILICGKEGTGKSNLVLYLMSLIEELTGEKIDIGQVCQTIEIFIRRLSSSKICTSLALDEGSQLDSKRSLEALSKDLSRAYTVMRAKRLITFLCFTNPVRMQAYFVEDRVKYVMLIKSRGLVYVYTNSRMLWILNEIKKERIKSIKQFFRFKPDLKVSVPKYDGHLMKDYTSQKMENIDNILDYFSKKYQDEGEAYSLEEACKILNMSRPTLRRYIKDGRIKCDVSLGGTRMRIKRDDLDEYVKSIERDPLGAVKGTIILK